MRFNLFGRGPVAVEQKSVPTQSGMYLDSYVQAPLPLRNSPTELVNMNTSYTWICNNYNAKTVASCKYKLYANGRPNGKSLGDWVKTGKVSKKHAQWVQSNIRKAALVGTTDIVEIIEHPVLDLLNSVNGTFDAFTLMEITESYLGLIGNAYWLINKGSDGLPESIDVLPAEFISVLIDKSNRVVGYRQQVDGTGYKREFKADEVLHFKQPALGAFRRINTGLDTPTGLYGMGSLEAVLAEAQLLESINTYERSLMDNHGRPDFVVKYSGGTLEDARVKILTKQWNQLFRGVRQAGKVQVMDNQFEIQELGFNPKDLAYQEGKKWLRTAICNAFGTPESFISNENSNRASSQVAIEQFFRFVILPKLCRFAGVINAGLMPLYDDNLWMVYDDPVPQNFDANIKQETSDISNGIVSVNEIRASRGLDPYPEAEYDRPKGASKGAA